MARVDVDYPERTLFEHRIPVRITDLNYGNHLGHDTLVSLLHEARARCFKSFGMEEWNVEGAGVILVDLAVSYRAQVRYGQTLRVEIAVGAVGSRGCDFLYRVTDAASGTIVALARTGILFYDYAAERVVAMPPRFRALLETTPPLDA